MRTCALPASLTKAGVIAGFTKTSRDGVFYQPKGRCYIDPRIVTALSLSLVLSLRTSLHPAVLIVWGTQHGTHSFFLRELCEGTAKTRYF